MDPDLDLESEPIDCASMSFLSVDFSLLCLSETRGPREPGRGLIRGSSRLTADEEPVILKAV